MSIFLKELKGDFFLLWRKYAGVKWQDHMLE